VKFFEKLIPPAASVAATVAGMAAGAPPDLVTTIASAAGALASIGTTDRPVDEVVADEANRGRRARAYEAFGEAVAQSWLAGGFMFTFKPQFVGYVHGVMGLVRAQRRFEDETSWAISSLSSVLLYASTDVQDTSAALLNALSIGLAQIARCKPGSPEAAEAQRLAGGPFGEAFLAWRKATGTDLGIAS
jgi:hypothetical protein